MPVPQQPQVLTPQNGQLCDYTGGITFTWQYNNADASQDQTHYAFRRFSVWNADWMYWNGTAWVLYTETFVASSAKSLTIPAAAWYQTWQAQQYFVDTDGQFENAGGIGNWTGNTNCSVARDTGTVFQGSGSMKITVTANGTAVAMNGNGTSTFMRANVGANEINNLRCWIKAGSAVSRTATIGIRWYTSGKAFISDTDGPAVTFSNDKWYMVEATNLVPPTNAAYACVTIKLPTTPLAGETYFVDGVFYPYPGYEYIGMQETWLYSIAVKNSSGNSPYSEGRLLTTIYPNTVTVIAPTGAPTASRPLVTWANQSYSGFSQDAYRVKIFDSATYGGGGFDPSTSTPTWDSGVVVSTDNSVRVGANLVNGTAYRAYVQIRAGGATAGIWTAWAFSGFTATLTVPATPGLTVTPNPATGNFTLAVTNAANVKYVIERSADGGTTWEEVRAATRANPAPQGGAATTSTSVTDDEAPLRIPVTYRCYACTGTPLDLTYSAAQTAGAQRCDATKWWMRDPLTPASRLAIAQGAADIDLLSFAGSPFLPEGRTKPVVLFSRAPQGAKIKFELTTLSKTNHDAVIALLAARKTLCIQNVHGDRWYVRLTSDVTRTQIQAVPVVGENFTARHAYKLSFEATEVEAP